MKKLRFLILLCCAWHSLDLTAANSHHIGLGLSAYFFQQDLHEQFSNTVGYTASYGYTLPFASRFEPEVGIRLEYYVPKKDGFDNENILITPQVSALLYNELFPLGGRIGYDINYWKQTKTYIQKEVFHEDILYGLALGIFSKTRLPGAWGHIEYSLTYHLQQFALSTTFFALGVQYVLDL